MRDRLYRQEMHRYGACFSVVVKREAGGIGTCENDIQHGSML
jgi:hypothetical protein